MNVFEAVRTLLAVRQYKDEPVADDVVRQIIDAGRLTGSSMNKQPWHFIVVQQRETLQEIGKIATTGPYVAEAAFAIVVVIERTQFAMSDGSRAIQSMTLTAWDHGLGSNWVGFMGPDAIKPLLSIPDDMDVLAVVPFGKPAGTIGHGNKQRKPLGDVVHRESFNPPFA